MTDLKVYFDLRDWWVGVFVDEYHWYICPIPTLVFRFRRGFRKEDIVFCKFMDEAHKFKTDKEFREAIEYLQALKENRNA